MRMYVVNSLYRVVCDNFFLKKTSMNVKYINHVYSLCSTVHAIYDIRDDDI